MRVVDADLEEELDPTDPQGGIYFSCDDLGD